MVIHLQQHPQRGDHDIGECRLLSTEDSTAEGRFHCIVFHCCTAVHRLFPRRDDVTMLHHIFHTHTACMNSLCFQLFYVDGIDAFQHGDIITIYSIISTIVIRSCDFGLRIRFCFFLVNCFS